MTDGVSRIRELFSIGHMRQKRKREDNIKMGVKLIRRTET
jgi:hypothetical protein